MKVLVDLTFVNPCNPTGVSNFIFRLMHGLNLYTPVEILLLGTPSNYKFLKKSFEGEAICMLSVEPSSYMWMNVIENRRLKLETDKYIDKYQVDFFLIPFFTFKSIIPDGCKSVAVIHDLQPFYLNGRIKNIFYRFLFERNIVHLNHIITISNFSKKELCRLFPVVKNKVERIYNSVEISENHSEKTNNRIIGDRYILDVNSMMPYKNHIAIIKAFELIKDKIPQKLVIKSRNNRYWKAKIWPYIYSHNLQNSIILLDKNLNNAEMNNLYKNADLFITASMYEGFGFTPIEAAINKVPVISSTCTALYETTLGLLNYYEPENDYKALSDKILLVLNCKDKQRLEEISSILKEKYSLKNQALEYYNFFKSI